MRANKENNNLNDKLLLTKSDSTVISRELGVNKDFVNQLRRGDRGKRKTSIQEMVRKALQKRSQQNEDFVRYCNQLKETCVVPK